MKKLLAFFLVLLLSTNQIAMAHTNLINSNPKSGATLKLLPKKIWVEFDGNIISLGNYEINKLSIIGPKGEYVIGKPAIKGSRLSSETKTSNDKGNYTITYRIVSEDGHPISGKIKFKIN